MPTSFQKQLLESPFMRQQKMSSCYDGYSDMHSIEGSEVQSSLYCSEYSAKYDDSIAGNSPFSYDSKYVSDAFSEDRDMLNEHISFPSTFRHDNARYISDDGYLSGYDRNTRDIAHVRYLSKQANDYIEGENYTEFWRCVAQTLDRVFFIVFGLIMFFSAVGLFLVAPLRKEEGH